MYINDVVVFEQQVNERTLTVGSTVDLSLSDSATLDGFAEIFKSNPYPAELTIDFGAQRLSNQCVASLVQGLSFSKASPGVTLCFWGKDALLVQGVNDLIDGFLSNKFQPALTIYLTGQNLETCLQERTNPTQRTVPINMFHPFIDAITSRACLKWLSIEFSDSTLSHDSVTYLVDALNKNDFPIGLSINIGLNGTPEQRHAIHLACEKAAKMGRTLLKSNPRHLSFISTHQSGYDTRALLMKRTTETLNRVIPEARKFICLKIHQHMDALKLALISKADRIKALERLCNKLLHPGELEKTVHDIINEWEDELIKNSRLRHADVIKPFFFCRSASSSTQQFIAKLKKDHQSVMPDSLPPVENTKSFSISST